MEILQPITQEEITFKVDEDVPAPNRAAIDRFNRALNSIQSRAASRVPAKVSKFNDLVHLKQTFLASQDRAVTMHVSSRNNKWVKKPFKLAI